MYDYALVHLKFTLPPAIILYGLGKPLRTRRERYRTNLLILIAVIATTPWDAYLIRSKIWSYPASAVLGPTLWSIPIEQYFFFFVQTYITSCLYSICSTAVVHSVYLQPRASRRIQLGGALGILAGSGWAIKLYAEGGKGTYLALILLWCLPFLLLLWTLAYTHIVALPWTSTILPVMLPTVCLWLVDTFALRRGTWVIENGTKFGVHLWPHLEIEEAIFFFVTNLMIVFGHVAADLAFAVCDTFPELFPPISGTIPSLATTLRAITLPCSAYPEEKLEALQSSLRILQDKSKSFSTASILFEGRLRVDLLTLYAICRVADDAIDEAASPVEARLNLQRLSEYFQLACTSLHSTKELSLLLNHFTECQRKALSLLPSLNLPYKPFSDLLQGFSTDLHFPTPTINTTSDLQTYAENVASSVAELSVLLAWSAYSHPHNTKVMEAAREMGLALQYVNIARDVPEDQSKGRMYLPSCSVLQPLSELTSKRLELVDQAEEIGSRCMDAIDSMPEESRLGLKAACAVYLEVGRKVRIALKKGEIEGRARVGKFERLGVLLRVVRTGR